MDPDGYESYGCVLGGGTDCLAEVLNSLPNLSAPAACASQGASEFSGVQSDLRRMRFKLAFSHVEIQKIVMGWQKDKGG